jgi:hypothetical protein
MAHSPPFTSAPIKWPRLTASVQSKLAYSNCSTLPVLQPPPPPRPTTASPWCVNKEGKLPQAEAYFRRSIELYERKNAANMLEGSAPLLNLATQLTETNKLNEAEPLLLRVQRIRQQLEGQDSVGAADSPTASGCSTTCWA